MLKCTEKPCILRFMDRQVNRKIFDTWIEDNSPDGLSKLAVNSNVSSSTIGTIRRGHVPTKPVRRALAAAMNRTEDELFPLAREEAS